MNTFLHYAQGNRDILSHLLSSNSHREPDSSTLSYAELLHDLFCQGEHVNDDVINEGYCSWLDEEMENEWFSQWFREEHNRWYGIAEKFIEAGVDPETAVEARAHILGK